MPTLLHRLTAEQIDALDRPALLCDGGGLYFQQTTSGSRGYVFRYSKGGRADRRTRCIGLGGQPSYPNKTDRIRSIKQMLAAARVQAEELRAMIRRGEEPARREAAARPMTFDEAAQAFLDAKGVEFKNPKHRAQWSATLKTYASPTMGRVPVAVVEVSHVLTVLQQKVGDPPAEFWRGKTETASRVRGRIERVLDWAKAHGHRTGDNPAAWRGCLDVMLPAPAKLQAVDHHAALRYADCPAFVTRLRIEAGMTARALEFLMLTAARSGEVRGATWGEIDKEARIWTVPGDRMKAGKAHHVPLSDTALALLSDMPRFAGEPHLFTHRGKTLGENAFRALLLRMGEAVTAHGFRSAFKDWARAEQGTAFADEVSELCLAHVSTDATRAAYARDGLLTQRAELLSRWAAYLTGGLRV